MTQEQKQILKEYDEPAAWSLRFRHGDKYERVGPVNHMTTFGSKEEADIYANGVARGLDGNPEPERRPVVVPLYTAPQPAPDVSALGTHWAVKNPGKADQYRREAEAARVALGFSANSDDVSPREITDSIQAIKAGDRQTVSALVEALEYTLDVCPAIDASGEDAHGRGHAALAAYRKGGDQ